MEKGFSDKNLSSGRRFKLTEQIREVETGARAHYFIHEEPSQEQIFYYCSPAISDDGRYIPCCSNVSGAWQIHVIDRREKVSIQLSNIEGGVPVGDPHCYLPEKNQIFFIDRRSAYAANIEDASVLRLFEAPEDHRITSLSARGNYLAFSYCERVARGRLPEGRHFSGYPALSHRPRSIIVAIDLRTGDAAEVWGDYSCLCHVELSPVDDDLVMFCDQSWERRQQEVYLVRRSFCEDKRAWPVLAAPGGDYRGRTLDYIGHSFFTRDGQVAAQYCEYGNLDAKMNFTDTAMFNLVIDPDGYHKRKAKFPGSGKPTHVHCQTAGGLWVGDGWARPDGRLDNGWISLIRNNFETQETENWPLLPTNHTWDRPFHPHPWISPNEDFVVLAHNTGKSDNHMVLVELPERFRTGE
ncbi:MAG TPA: hypothetical protein PKN80_08540 [bacterium]|nr:hypothetical protein [bacterium]HNS49324.1 hypothetical protein [bacterium]